MPALQRLVGIEHDRQFLVLDPDQVDRVARGFLVFGHYRHHFFADESDLAGCKDAVLLVVDAGHPGRRIVAGKHRMHARQGARCIGVDAYDFRVRMRAAQHLCVQHAPHLQIGAILSLAQNLLKGVDLNGLFSDGRNRHDRTLRCLGIVFTGALCAQMLQEPARGIGAMLAAQFSDARRIAGPKQHREPAMLLLRAPQLTVL